MKKYFKIIDNIKTIKTSSQIVIVKDGMATYNPSEEMIIADGWTEYVPVVKEPTEEEIFNNEKEYKIEEIIRYDSSDKVNIFYVNNMPIWLDKATRACLMLRFQAEKQLGKTDTCIWYNGMSFTVPVDLAIYMLYQLEDYAAKCYDNTQKHIATVQQLTTIEEVEKYDYRTGYPELPVFNTSLVG